jgi:hypothetical protein
MRLLEERVSNLEGVIVNLRLDITRQEGLLFMLLGALRNCNCVGVAAAVIDVYAEALRK